MEKFNLRDGVQPQTFGLGVKEVWEIPEEVRRDESNYNGDKPKH